MPRQQDGLGTNMQSTITGCSYHGKSRCFFSKKISETVNCLNTRRSEIVHFLFTSPLDGVIMDKIDVFLSSNISETANFLNTRWSTLQAAKTEVSFLLLEILNRKRLLHNNKKSAIKALRSEILGNLCFPSVSIFQQFLLVIQQLLRYY